MKRKLAATFGVVVLALGLGACADKNNANPAPSVSASTNATPPTTLPDGTSPAPQEVTGPDTPAEGVKAPKGEPKFSTDGFSTAAYKKDTVNYLYAVGGQTVTADGAFADLTVHKPELGTPDYHTLAEIAVRSSDQTQIVEVGWTVDRVVNGDDDPHLFVFNWVNNTPGCYNGCGFVNYGGATLKAGMTVPTGTTKQMGIQHFSNAWWVSYDRKWVGYFPDSLWTGASPSVTFNKTGIVQMFGEVAAATTTPCTDMGSGVQATATTGAAQFANINYVNSTTPVNMLLRTQPTPTTLYSIQALNGSKRTFKYGGTGQGAC